MADYATGYTGSQDMVPSSTGFELSAVDAAMIHDGFARGTVIMA
jgi:hypothetical protein